MSEIKNFLRSRKGSTVLRRLPLFVAVAAFLLLIGGSVLRSHSSASAATSGSYFESSCTEDEVFYAASASCGSAATTEPILLTDVSVSVNVVHGDDLEGCYVYDSGNPSVEVYIPVFKQTGTALHDYYSGNSQISLPIASGDTAIGICYQEQQSGIDVIFAFTGNDAVSLSAG